MKSRPGNRRSFLTSGGLLLGGLAVGRLTSSWEPFGTPASSAAWAADPASPSPEQRLKELKIELPPAPNPVAVYTPAVLVGNTLYVSGHGPRRANGDRVVGKVGADMTLEEGHEAARLVGLQVLSTVRAAVGSLDRVVRVAKVLGMVNCTPDFTQQPQVINGFSELMVEVFGDLPGKAARSAVGMSALPGGIPVEIESIFEIRA